MSPRSPRPATALQLLQQMLQLVAKPVTRGDLAGEVFGVGDAAFVPGAGALVLHPVAVVLAVQGQQDERRRVRGLQRQHKGQEDEGVRVEPPGRRGMDVPGEPQQDEHRHVDQEPGGAEEARDALGELPERLRVVVQPRDQRTPDLPRLVESSHAALLHPIQASAHVSTLSYLGWSPFSAMRTASASRRASSSSSVSVPSSMTLSRQSSGSRWSWTSSTVTAPSSRPVTSTMGTDTWLLVAR